MSFVNLAFLWGLPLLAVPVAIHLLSRRRQEVVKWGAMQFLLTSSIRRRKIWRLDDLVLMLIRALAVVALVMALARPLWYGSNPGGGANRDIIFVWDVSMSTGRTLAGGDVFGRMLEKTEELFGGLGASDTVRGLITIGRGEWLGAEPESATEEQKGRLLDALRKTGVTEASADWFACLQTALRVAPPPGRRARLVVVVSDGQAVGWHADDKALRQNLVRTVEESKIPAAIEVHDVVGPLGPAHNIAVDVLTTPRQLLGVDESFVVEAVVRNHGHTSLELGTVDWMIDDTSLGKSTIGPLGVGQSTKATLKHVTGKPGFHRLMCRLETLDELPGDNSQSLVLETIDHVPLLLVDDSTEEDPLQSDRGYVLAALGQDKTGAPTTNGEGIFRVTTIPASEFGTQTLSNYRGILFSNTPDLDEVAVRQLMDFVRHGGGLWLCLGGRTNPKDFNRRFHRLGAGLAPWPIDTAQGDPERREEFVAIHPPATEHPATALLSDTQRLDIDLAKVFRRFPFTTAPARGQVPVLLQTGTGEALAVEGALGRGRVIVQAIPMGVRWSNLPLTQSFVPLVHEWLWYVIQPTGISLNLRPGEPVQVALPSNEHVRNVYLKGPGGAESSLTIIGQGDRSLALGRQTQRPGAYEVVIQAEGKPDDVRPYRVARSADESNLDPWPAELTANWNESRVVRVNPVEPLAMPAAVFGQRTGEPLSFVLLVMVVLALLAELWIARRIAAKRFGFRTAPGESAMPGSGRFAISSGPAHFENQGGNG